MAVTADTDLPGDNMTKVNPAQSNGPRLNVDNGAGNIASYNQTTDTVAVPAFEVQYLVRDKLVA